MKDKIPLKEEPSFFIKKLSDNSFLLLLSLSFLISGLLIFGFSIFAKGNSQTYTSRQTISAILVALWLWIFPSLDRNKKDSIIFALGKYLVLSFVLSFTMYYWLTTIKSDKTFLILDILFAFGLIISFFFIIDLLRKLFNALVKIIKKFFNYFNTEQNKKFINICKNVTAAIISLSTLSLAIGGLIRIIKTMFT